MKYYLRLWPDSSEDLPTDAEVTRETYFATKKRFPWLSEDATWTNAAISALALNVQLRA